MAKKVDKAGHWLIKDNPLSSEGVFMYSGKVIDPSGEFGLEPDTLYPVYRPAEELAKSAESFNGVEIRNEHEMVGDGEGMTPADSSICGGTIYNVRMNPDNESQMIGDMRIFGNQLRNLIKSGKKELSLGYFCRYRKDSGKFNGKAYDFVQCDLEGNHVALVKAGRMGSSVRVFDSITFDSLEIPMPQKENEKQDSETRKTITEMLEGRDEDILKKCKDAIEGILNPKEGEDGEAEEKPKGEDDPCPNCGTELGLKEETKDEGEKDDKGDEGAKDEGKKSEDCGDEGEKPKEDDTPTPAGDKAMDMKEVMREIARRDRIADGVADIIGTFDHSEMTAAEVATYACDKLELPTTGDCVSRIEGFIAAHSKAKVTTAATTAMDAAEDTSDFIKSYLKK